jgi:CDP-diacylglycerol--serine O-phosphatidyltransferase
MPLTITKHIPNFITSLNLFSGCIGITAAFNGHLEAASCFIALSAVFDFMDGMAARLLHVKSEIGKQLDSLADVISFGLLPGVILFELMKMSANLPGDTNNILNPFPYLAFILPVFSALRLAKFNIDLRQTESFLGVPTPATAIVFGSLPLVLQQAASKDYLQFVAAGIGNYYVLALTTIIFCALLVSEIPLFALKFKNLSWADNKAQFILIAFAVLSIVLLGFAGLPLTIIAYILLSLAF